MAQVYENIGHLVLMLLLLCCSAFFSGSETAFFSLSRRQIILLQKSTHKFQNLVAKILNKPSNLLGSLLFGNMVVNILFFAVSSVFIVRIKHKLGVTSAAICACFSFCSLVLFGEILPKSLAYVNSKLLSTTAALPVFLCIKVLSPLLFVFRFFIAEPVISLLFGPRKIQQPVTTTEFRTLIEQIQKRGLITADENKLLTEIIELGFLKVRHCLKPRVDMITCGVTESADKAAELMLKNRLTKLPLYLRKIDNIVGHVYLRQLLLQPNAPLEKLVQQVQFVPEQKTIESLLEFFRKSQSDTAVVVDEYGGIAGSINLEDIAEELLGPIEDTGQIEPIEQINPFEYRLAGSLALHDWSSIFGIQLSETRVSTLAGLVTAGLGKIPKAGDTVCFKNLKFTIEKVRKYRIETIILTLETIRKDDN